MAMMMTGRVLLVCALCVLWCGAAVVVSSDVSGFASHAEINVLFGRWYSLMMSDCESTSKFINGTVNKLALEECKSETKKVLCDGFCGDHSVKRGVSYMDPTCLPDVGTEGTVDQQAQEQIPTLRETGKPAPPPTPQGLSEESPDSSSIPAVEGTPVSSDVSSQEPPIQASTKLAFSVQQAEPNSAGSVLPTQSQEGPESMHPTKEPSKESSTPDTGNQRDLPTEDRAETKSRPAKANDTSNEHNEEGTAEESSSDTPASGAALTEGTESETPGSGLRETKTPHTTVEGSNTVTPGDGESSPTAPPAGESDAATNTTPNNHVARNLNNNGNNTITAEVDQKEATRKTQGAPDSTNTAAANSQASATAIKNHH
ncbi:mucin-associated surface protein (MASP), putative [Trypanosoma cruzi marinkellei]|uniref:Mucin-associated surface protein (MASP), putative n=1 Tax=Trypanosoma cruzi marinkellei TaxID=85056 RepID=K2MUK3_TRYCR|nr:mucin-associated surface protein (MASP), putative [Trypanosoma cruzi marinkellei]